MAAVARLILKSTKNYYSFRPLYSPTIRQCTTKSSIKEDEDLDKPIKYSTSKAATWKAESSFSGNETEDIWPWYQPLVISGSLVVFMVYFGILREENDVDQGLTMSLYDRVEGLEEVQLRNAISYYNENEKGYDTGPMEKRLAELEALKAKAASLDTKLLPA